MTSNEFVQSNECERIAYEQAAETAEKRATKLEQQRAAIVSERDEAVARADAAEADAKLWRGATATLPLTAEALGKVMFESEGDCSWDNCAFKDTYKNDAASIARAVMAALSSDAADAVNSPGVSAAGRRRWRAFLSVAAKAALALPEQETPQPQQTEAAKLKWSPGPRSRLAAGTLYALDLRRNIEALDARLRKLEGSR